MAGVVRDLIDDAAAADDVDDDVFYRHVMTDRTGSGTAYDAEQDKRDLYRA